jgi:hypothetical protein
MDDEAEDLLRRKPAPRPYRASDLRLEVPDAAIQATIRLLQGAGRRESGVLWYGQRDPAGNGTVEYVVAPYQRMAKGNYHVGADALAAVVARLEMGWKPLAQIHSHPGEGVEHSTYDDEMLSSRRTLSLVFPFYGRTRDAFPTGVGVHEWQVDYWHLLHREDAARRLRVISGHVKVEDLR